LGPSFHSVALDLLDQNALEHVLEVLVPTGISAFVHCAGIMRTGRIADARDEDADRLWRLHVGVPVAVMRRLAEYLPDRHGRVVLISSRGALGRAGRGVYAATKSGLVGLGRSWAIELIPRGITVNIVGPGATDTPMLSDPARTEKAQVDLPIGRLIKPEEVAALIAFLISAEAAAITGQTIYICGGGSLSVQL
jgi:NAD(P)-dependent dehydrogenase (short-subunit alcohol dehydrogenase family)